MGQLDENLSMVDSASDDRTANNTNAARHNYRVLSDEEKAAMVAVKDAGQAFIDAIHAHGVPGRESSIAITNAEQAIMWVVKGITA